MQLAIACMYINNEWRGYFYFTVSCVCYLYEIDDYARWRAQHCRALGTQSEEQWNGVEAKVCVILKIFIGLAYKTPCKGCIFSNKALTSHKHYWAH